MFSKITLIIACCLIFSACFFKGDKKLDIHFSADSSQIELSGIEDANLFQLHKYVADTAFAKTLLNVVVQDDGRELKDRMVTGSLQVQNKVLVFKPHQPFSKGTTYVVQTVLNSSFGKTRDILRADLGHNPKMQEKRLRR